MNARVELTAMFAPFLSGTLLEEAARDAYALVLNEGADALEARVADVDVDTRTTWAGMDAAYLRHLAASSVPVPDNTTGDEELKTAVEYGIDFGKGVDITDGFDRALQEARLGRWRDTHPNARLVQRTVRYGAWTEVTS